MLCPKYNSLKKKIGMKLKYKILLMLFITTILSINCKSNKNNGFGIYIFS